jgi:hypothetical protein
MVGRQSPDEAIYTGRPGAASALMITLIIMYTVACKRVPFLKSLFYLFWDVSHSPSSGGIFWNWFLLIARLLQSHTVTSNANSKSIPDGSPAMRQIRLKPPASLSPTANGAASRLQDCLP